MTETRKTKNKPTSTKKSPGIPTDRIARGSCIIMPIFSLPSPYGIGTFGQAAYDFVDFLDDAGQRYWQILPLGPTSYGDSPYQSFSSFAGNPYFIDLDLLIEEGYLERKDIEHIEFSYDDDKVNYGLLYNYRISVLQIAFTNAKDTLDEELAAFRAENSDWIEDYALFMAIKKDLLDIPWLQWPEPLKRRDPKALAEIAEILKEKVAFYIFIQYLFFLQWDKLKKYTNRHQISIIGDIPIYIAMDSAEAWANPEMLQLDPKTLDPLAVAGAPPDAYSEDGQLWGNPLYDWDYLKATKYDFWVSRIRHTLRLYDIIRLDHFRGFESYWSIPAEDDTAKYGTWAKGPGLPLFKALEKALGDVPFILEDLGHIGEEVYQLKETIDKPGMKVLQFAFNEDRESEYLPHNFVRNTVVYTSTHDSDTLTGWLENLNANLLDYVVDYFALSEEEGYSWGVIRGAMASVAQLSIAQLQDFLELDNTARINAPGTLGENWQWRAKTDYFSKELAERIKALTRLYGRI